MKTFRFRVALIAIMAVLMLLLFLQRKTENGERHTPVISLTNQGLKGKQLHLNTSSGTSFAEPAVETQSLPLSLFSVEQRRKQKEQAIENSKKDWRAAIEFYGKVVDENNNPIGGADIEFEWNNLSGSHSTKAVSDALGLFSLRGEEGKYLAVRVSKQGYHTSKQDSAGFFYAGRNNNFIPEPNNPIVYHLLRKGATEPLIHYAKSYLIPKNGTPVEIDPASGRQISSNSNVIKVECWTEDAGKKSGEKYDWRCRVTIVGGGLQSYADEFPFTAPVQGYFPSDEIDMTVRPDIRWQTDVERSYFIRTFDGKFGRMTFRMIAHGGHFCRIDLFLNPSGSRNLEYDKTVRLEHIK